MPASIVSVAGEDPVAPGVELAAVDQWPEVVAPRLAQLTLTTAPPLEALPVEQEFVWAIKTHAAGEQSTYRL